MSVLKIVTHPSPILRRKSRKVRRYDEILRALVKDMFETMYAYNGVGLAAIQVAVPLKLFITDDNPPNNPRVFINPEIELLEDEGEDVQLEGCLSIPGRFGFVRRAKSVKIRYEDLQGNPHEEIATGFLARIIQHEYDHTEGILFIDRTDKVYTEEELRELFPEEADSPEVLEGIQREG